MTARRQVSIFINGREINNTLKSIYSEKRKINNELRNMVIGSEEYEKKIKEYRQINRIVDDHRQSLRGVDSTWNKLVKGGITKFAGLAAGAFAVDNIVRYGAQLFKLSAEMEVLGNKARTVFGDQLPRVTMEAERNAAAMGLTTREYIGAAAAIQDLLIPMGFQREEAANISIELTNLSGALSEWTGGQVSSAEVSRILSKALLGEREELKQLGIAIQEADVQTRLREKGLDKLTGTMLQQAKAAATLELITEKSVDAQTAYAENADTLVRRQAEISAKISEVSEKLATLLIPVFEKLINLADATADFFLNVADGINSVVNPANAAVKAFDDQTAAVADLEKNLLPLLNRYDELTTQSNLSQEEQDELARVIKEIGKITPSAVTQINDYGEALSINATTSQNFLEAEKARLKFVNEESITALEKEIKQLEARREVIKQNREAGGSAFQTGPGTSLQFTYDNDALRKLDNDVANITERIKGAQAELARLTGDSIDTGSNNIGQSPIDLEAAAAEEEARKKAEEERKKAAEKREKELEKNLKRLNEITEKFREEARLAELDEDEQAIERLRARYQKEIDLAADLEKQGVEAATAQRLELERLRDIAIGELRAEQLEARISSELDQELALEAAAEEERLRAEEERLINRETRRQEIQQQLTEEADAILLSSQDLALQELDAHYQDLIKEAEEYGLDTTRITEAYRKDRLGLIQKFNKEEEEDNKKSSAEKLKELQSAFSAFSDLIGSSLDLISSKEKENIAAKKIATLAQLALDTASAISSLTRNSEANPANAVTFGGAGIAQFIAGIARITANIAKAKAVLSDAEIPQRKKGGYFNVRGADDGQLYNAKYIGRQDTGMLPPYPVVLASEGYGKPEYFVSNKDLQNPVVLNYVRAIDNITKAKQFQNGGINNGPLPDTQASPTPAPGINPVLFNQMIFLLQDISGKLDSFSAVLDDGTLVGIISRMRKLQNAAGGTL